MIFLRIIQNDRTNYGLDHTNKKEKDAKTTFFIFSDWNSASGIS